MKDLIASKSFWGMVLTILGPIIMKKLPGLDLTAVPDLFVQLSGALLALWGILSRKGPIGTVAGMTNPLAPKT